MTGTQAWVAVIITLFALATLGVGFAVAISREK